MAATHGFVIALFFARLGWHLFYRLAAFLSLVDEAVAKSKSIIYVVLDCGLYHIYFLYHLPGIFIF